MKSKLGKILFTAYLMSHISLSLLWADDAREQRAATNNTPTDKIANELDAESQDLYSNFTKTQLRFLIVYAERVLQIISAQDDVIKTYQQSLNRTNISNSDLAALAERLLEQLQEWIEADLPFLTSEQHLHIDYLYKLLSSSDISMVEKIHRILEAYEIEAEYNFIYESYRPNLKPIYRVEPVYPMFAIAKGIEGWVIIEFSITENGTVVEPKVLASEPPNVFEKTSLTAVAQWRYPPASKGQSSAHIQFELRS